MKVVILSKNCTSHLHALDFSVMYVQHILANIDMYMTYLHKLIFVRRSLWSLLLDSNLPTKLKTKQVNPAVPLILTE